MKSENLVNVIIPVYKEILTYGEQLSLNQALKILFKYPITLISYKALDLTDCLNEFPELKVEYFDKSYFKNLQGYNKLLLSNEFYKRFSSYRYILIYQLDAWIFRDELDYWCEKGYDYIGAPWVDMNVFNWLKLKIYPRYLYYIHLLLGKGKFLSKVGNGGFSLRKVSTFVMNLNVFSLSAKNWQANEDSFYSHFVKTFNPFFKIAPYRDALRFSFDSSPKKAYESNNKMLPFGCHAWDREKETYKGNRCFWEAIINNDFLSENIHSNSKF